MDFKASTDLSVRIITIATIVLFIFIIYRMSISIINTPITSRISIVFYFVIILLISLLFFTFGFSVQKYRVNENSLVIVSLLYNKNIRKEDIHVAGLIEDGKSGNMIRTFGVGGLFGYYGWYRSSAFGPFFFYGTQMKNLVFLELKNGKRYIITPDDTSLLMSIKPFAANFNNTDTK